jgi:hypothetical protein
VGSLRQLLSWIRTVPRRAWRWICVRDNRTTFVREFFNVVIVLGVPILIWMVWKHPENQAADAHQRDPSLTVEQLATLENEIRRTWATIAAGLFVLISGYLAWRNVAVAERNLAVAQKNLTVSQEGQITERFTKAIEQLGASDSKGHPRLELRLGGIYALERIAQDSPERDHRTIMEVLAAYVRNNVKLPKNEELDGLQVQPTDIMAILAVFGRRHAEQRRHEFAKPDLARISLRRSRLEFLNLSEVNLEGADFSSADLSFANLSGANLSGANFSGANLDRANLRGANFNKADLRGAYLIAANLRGTNLTDAKLTGANFSGTNVSEAPGLAKWQIDSAITDDMTTLPGHVSGPTL